MRGAWGRSRAGLGLLLAVLVLVPAAVVQAQDGATDPTTTATPDQLPPDLRGQVLVLDQDRLFQQSRFGQASFSRDQTAARALEAENARILADLIAEEQALTTQRATLPPEEFTRLADAFDQKAERIRREQDAKLAALVKAREADRTAFLRAIVPILGELLREKGAAAVLDATGVVLFSPDHDITDEATRRIDAVLTTLPTGAPESAPVPD